LTAGTPRLSQARRELTVGPRRVNRRRYGCGRKLPFHHVGLVSQGDPVGIPAPRCEQPIHRYLWSRRTDESGEVRQQKRYMPDTAF
jgi:hypothetical protein